MANYICLNILLNLRIIYDNLENIYHSCNISTKVFWTHLWWSEHMAEEYNCKYKLGIKICLDSSLERHLDKFSRLSNMIFRNVPRWKHIFCEELFMWELHLNVWEAILSKSPKLISRFNSNYMIPYIYGYFVIGVVFLFFR